jgi:hypothetical protein
MFLLGLCLVAIDCLRNFTDTGVQQYAKGLARDPADIPVASIHLQLVSSLTKSAHYQILSVTVLAYA